MARKIFEQDEFLVSALNLDERLIDRLLNFGFKRLGQLRKALPRDVFLQCRLSMEDAQSIGAELRRVYEGSPGSWNERIITRQIRNAEKAQRETARKTQMDESVFRRFIYREATGKHYKKPRKKGLL